MTVGSGVGTRTGTLRGYSWADIESHCGKDAVDYARNKNRGGRSGASGREYELYYATYNIALAAAVEIERGCAGDDIVFADQLPCFVDDLVVDNHGARVCSQLKRGAVSWDRGGHPVAEDFRLQKKLDAALGLPAQHELVVAELATRDSLDNSRPPDLSEITVVRFSDKKELAELRAEHPELQQALDQISIRAPSDVVRQQTFDVLLAACVTSSSVVTLRELIERVSARPDALVGSLVNSYVLPSDVGEILAGIQGFSYEVRRGHFYFECKGISGFAAYPCDSVEFAEFERFVREQRPSKFVQVHEILRRTP